jgi:type IV secretory pathway VirB4 component
VSTVDADQPRARRPRRLSRSRRPARQDRTGPHPEQGQGQGQTPFVPDSIAVGARHLEVGGEWVASFAVTGYPREVSAGWLQPLLTYPGRLDVSLHIDPVDPVTAANRLKRQLAKLESGRRHAADHGRLTDPQVEAATEDAYDLAARVARGEGKLFRLGLYLTVHATTADQLADEVAAVRALAASLLLDAKPTTYRTLQGWLSCLPFGLDLIGMRRTFDSAALSAAFPFTSPDLPAADPTSIAAPTGVLYGFNIGSQCLVHWDRFACDNHNAVILGRSGAGKSYLVKLELLRSLFRGIGIAVIDPEDEYARLAAAVGGTHTRLGHPGVHLNPFDLPIHTRPDGHRLAPRDALIRRSLFTHTTLAVLFGQHPTPDERTTLDKAITTTYQHAGITADPRTWNRPAPLLADLATTLTHTGGDPHARQLAARLHPFTHGAFAGLFNGPTTPSGEAHLLVFSLRDLPDELKPAGTLLALDIIWRQVTNPALRRPRLVVVDEAWLLMKQPAGADFLFRMAKSARKHWAGLTVATQDTADVLAHDLGKAIIANAATQILLRQAPQAIGEIARTFGLSDGEQQFLLAATPGQGLLAAGTTQRVAFQAVASPAEHALVTTNPAELATTHASGHPDDPEDTGFLDLDLDADPAAGQWPSVD